MKKDSTVKPTTSADGMSGNKMVKRRGLSGQWFWLLLLGAIAFVQWPSLKELYYELSGAEIPEQTIAWQHDLDSAMKIAHDEDKPILAVFGASWCPPCRSMKREVWPNAQVSAAVEAGFVPLYVDVDDGSQSELVTHYQVGSIPAVLIIDRNGKVVEKRNTMSVSATLAFLASGANAS